MSLIDRYILKEWAVGFVLTLGVVLGMLVLQNMYESLSDLLNTDATAQQIVIYYLLALPGYLPTILPISFLVSLLFSLGNLHRNNEIIAMRAAGSSLLRISRSLWFVGLALSGFVFYLTAQVIPKTVEQARTFFENLEYASQDSAVEDKKLGLIYNLGFDNADANRLWFMNRFSERAWLAMGVNVHTRNDDGVELSRLSAKEAYFNELTGHWVFLDGRELIMDAETGDPLRTVVFKERGYEAYKEDPVLMLSMHKDPDELSLLELKRVMDTVPAEENPAVHAYTTRYFNLLAAPFSCVVIVGLAVPFAVAGVRQNPMIGISKCIGYFGVFFVLMSVASVLGERQIIEPVVAAWLPNGLMFCVGLWLFKRAR